MHADEMLNYPIEFLNSMDISGVPPHKLSFKIGALIILLHYIEPPRFHNGTRLAVKKAVAIRRQSDKSEW